MGKILICLLVVAQAYGQAVWIKDTNNPILPRGASGKWDSQFPAGPYVLFDETVYHFHL